MISLSSVGSRTGTGARGDYHHIGDGLGVKVLRKGNLSTAQIEYLFHIYAQSELPGMTGIVHACGMVQYRNKVRPAIWMEHLEGITCQEYAYILGKAHNSKFSELEAYTWGYECTVYSSILSRMTSIVEALKGIGLSCMDHDDNPSNFILTNDGRVLAIDFSEEGDDISLSVKKKIYANHRHTLEYTLPYDDKHLNILRNLGMVIKLG